MNVDDLLEYRQRLLEQLEAVEVLGRNLSPVWKIRTQKKKPATVLANMERWKKPAKKPASSEGAVG